MFLIFVIPGKFCNFLIFVITVCKSVKLFFDQEKKLCIRTIKLTTYYGVVLYSY